MGDHIRQDIRTHDVLALSKTQAPADQTTPRTP